MAGPLPSEYKWVVTEINSDKGTITVEKSNTDTQWLVTTGTQSYTLADYSKDEIEMRFRFWTTYSPGWNGTFIVDSEQKETPPKIPPEWGEYSL